jgi:preprotein translocase subunit SecF
MQNMDFYDGRHLRDLPPQFDKFDTEFFSRTSGSVERENEKARKKATKMITLIVGMVIVSFTTGLVLGIKFAGGAERKIVDDRTLNAMNNIGEKMSEAVKDITGNAKPANQIYPKVEYPFVIQLGKEYSETDLKPVAQFLSSKGHTVIVSKNEQNFKIFTGPYKTEIDARKSLSEISLYKQYAIATNAQIIKRI